MFKLAEILMNITNLLFKYSSLILSVGFTVLGIWVSLFPEELSRNAGIAMFTAGLLFGLLIVTKNKRI